MRIPRDRPGAPDPRRRNRSSPTRPAPPAIPTSPTGLLTAPEAAELLGVGTSTVKRWTDDGRLPCVRTAGGHRRFEREAVTLAAGRGGPAGARAALFLEKLLAAEDPHAVPAELCALRARTGSWWRAAEELSDVLVEIGRLWEAGHVSIPAEHLASERLARGLASALLLLPAPAGAPRALLATAEGDEHTLGLSLAEIVLREAGWRTDWIGARTPTAALVAHIVAEPPGLVAMSASASSKDTRGLARQARSLAKICRETGARLLLGGSGPWPEDPAIGERVRSFEQLHRALSGSGT